MWSEDVVAEERPYLFGIAYRMLGSAADADDAVQQAFLQARDVTDVRTPRALLTTVVTRICLDEIKSARRRRETYVGPWLPEPLLTEPPPNDPVEDAQSVSTALLLVLETLSPLERAVWVLREAFDRDTDEVAVALDRKEDAVRQLLSRARDKLAAGRKRHVAPRASQESLAMAFLGAARNNDLDALVALLRSDVALGCDHGGKAKALKKRIFGADHVARYFTGMAIKSARMGVELRVTWLNGGLGLLTFEEGRLTTAIAFDIELGGEGGSAVGAEVGVGADAEIVSDVDRPRVTAVHVMRNPDKLERLARLVG